MPQSSAILTAPLHDVAIIRSGFAPRRLVADPFGAYRGLQARDLAGDNGVAWARLMTPRLDADPSRHALLDGDLVVSLRGTHVRAWRITEPPPRVIAVGHLAILTAHPEKVDPGYLLWYLNHPTTVARFQSLAKGSNIPFVPLNDFRRFPIALPTLARQRAIGRLSRLARSERRLLQEIAALRHQLTDAQLLHAAQGR